MTLKTYLVRSTAAVDSNNYFEKGLPSRKYGLDKFSNPPPQKKRPKPKYKWLHFKVDDKSFMLTVWYKLLLIAILPLLEIKEVMKGALKRESRLATCQC